ncbi:MAG: PAS domain S-box protein [bacterium]
MSKPEPVKVLYMEDDAGLARLVKKKLERDGYVVDVASDGGRGLEVMEEKTYDFLLVDQEMPVHSGLEVIRILSFRDRLPPTIMVTGTGDERTAAKAIKLGASDYVVKDVEGGYLELLPLVVEQVLSGRRLAREKREAEEALVKSEEAYRTLAENLPVGIYRTTPDPKGRVVSGNPALASMFGYDREEDLAGVRVVDLYADRGERARFAEKIRAEGAVEGFETLFKRRDGGEFWGSLSARAVYDGDDVAYFDGVIEDITGRKRAEKEVRRARDDLEVRVEERTAELTETLEKLRASEETYRKLVETLPGGVSTTNFDGEITYASPQSAALHGFDRAEDLVGKKFFELLAPEVRAKAAAEFQKAIKEGGVRNLELTFLGKDRTGYPGEVSATLMKDADGRPTGFVATTRDITDRKRAEAAVRESEEKYRTLVEQARDGILIVQEGRLAFANGAFADMVGYAGDELAGKEFFAVVPPRLHKEVADQYERYEPGVEPARAYETCLLTRDGREVPVAATASQIQYGDRPAHLVFVYDLTERREQEKVVREQKWVLENVLHNMGELVYVLDPDTYEILFTNETTEAALGKGLAGQPCYRAIWGLEVPCHGCDIAKVFAGGGEETYTREAFNEKLGRWLRINVRSVPWLNGGQVCCAVATDISESKALEEEIIAHNRALNRMVKERTAALEAKNRELESFAYSVSHDLRAPLRSVEGFSRAVLDDYHEKLDEDGRDFLERIVGAAVRMDRLINDLLNYSQLGRSGVDYEIVDMNELVAVALGELDESIKAAGARVEVAGPLPRVNGDRSMLFVLLNNLVGNAIKYGKADVTPEVKISCREEGEKVVFAVEDNGIGLDMKFQDKVFDIFQRLHTEDEYPGTGIGLASAKKVVTAHGGRIWYESKPGDGTTFFFEVPGERGEGDSYGG